MTPPFGVSPLFLGFLAAFVWIGVAGQGVAVWMGAGKDAPPALIARTQLAASAVQIVPVLLIAALACRLAQVPRPTLGGAQLVLHGAGWAVLLLPAVAAVGTVASAVSQALGHPVDQSAHVLLKMIAGRESDAATRWMLIAGAVVAAPLLEETCYRGLLQRGIARVLRSNLGAVVATSLIFASMHIPVIPTDSLWPALTQVFALALVLGFVAARSGSVLPSMVVHATFNAVSIAVAVW
ncbi:MAG: CPBP family intramembrane metalloprotease [Phycisphaerales bacterium]